MVIGFDELRLNSALAGSKHTQLQQLAARDLFTQALPEVPLEIVNSDERERAVLSYLHGNCAHCHNGSERSESPLDLTFSTALANIIGRETEGSGQAAGIRVLPGDPDRSILFLALSGESDDQELQPMPPVGVQLRDAQTIELFRSWIKALR